MPNPSTVEQRVEALERAVADLQCQLGNGSPPPNWLEKIGASGAARDERFLEVVKLGRAFRDADRPPDEPGDEP